jgi:hypothetical protein
MPPPELSSRFPHMTVRASDVTFFDFRDYLRCRNSSPYHLADAHHLRAAAVVELMISYQQFVRWYHRRFTIGA